MSTKTKVDRCAALMLAFDLTATISDDMVSFPDLEAQLCVQSPEKRRIGASKLFSGEELTVFQQASVSAQAVMLDRWIVTDSIWDWKAHDAVY